MSVKGKVYDKDGNFIKIIRISNINKLRAYARDVRILYGYNVEILLSDEEE